MDPIGLIVEIGGTLDQLGVPWVLGGSMASSFAGEPRATMDVDVAVRMSANDVTALIAAVTPHFYASEPMIRSAVASRSSFNLIRLADSMKVDVFVLGDDLLDRRQLERRQLVSIPTATGSTDIWVGAPDDQILRKLRWFRDGGEASDRQWRDVIGLLRVQAGRIDLTELVATADQLALGDLARRAVAEGAGGS